VSGAPRWGAITDVPGVRVGHATRAGGGWLTGVTVVLPPPGTVGGVDVRGGGPGTHETDALDPTTLVPTVDAVVLTGGSAYGLAAAAGVQAWCEERARGFPVGPPEDPRRAVVPIVPAAAVFDLGRGGDPRARPDAALGRAAVEAAMPGDRAGDGAVDGTGDRWAAAPPERGCVGAGTGALVARGTLKGGVGTASLRVRVDGQLAVPGLPGLVVGALAVVNAFGSPADPVTGALLGTAFVPQGLARPPAPSPAAAAALRELLAAGTRAPAAHTTLAVVVTNAALDPAQCRRTATGAHAGLARAVDPSHTLLDGDTVFALSTGEVTVPPADLARVLPALQAAAATAVTLAVLDGVLAATTTTTAFGEVRGYQDVTPRP
jgi:L-aminopeptidase/D-esterase-like protein